ncbi:hypothetical protein AAVH_10117 [Aphelenchoides avenae]|nr:hypothetical protein AAVH_10117 [Aphelenchus avenae]
MRPLLLVLGLAFVTTVLISNVDAFIRCYYGFGDDYKDNKCLAGDGVRCAKGMDGGTLRRGCKDSSQCGGDIHCCDSDFCNGAVTYTPSAPLLIAVIIGFIAAFGI